MKMMISKMVATMVAVGVSFGCAFAGQVRVRERGMFSDGGTFAKATAAAPSASDAAALAKSAVVALGDRLGVNATEDDLRLRRADADAEGRSHVRLQQLFHGVEVDGRELIVHFGANGDVYEVNGDWLDTSALAAFPPPAVTVAGATLVVYCKGDDGSVARLTWRLRKGRRIVFIDAQTGETVHVRRAAPHSSECKDDSDDEDGNIDELIQFATDLPFPDGEDVIEVCNLPDQQGGAAVELPMRRAEDGTEYFVGHATNGVEVGVLDGIASPWFRETVKAAEKSGEDCTAEFLGKTGWTKFSDDPDDDMPSAIGIVNNVVTVLDYYQGAFNRRSYDGRGGRVAAWRFWQDEIDDIDSGYANAFWTSMGNNDACTNGCFFFGYDLTGKRNETSLDTCGHELTHGITSWSANLMYEGESGALNESFSDVIGVSCEFAVQPLAADTLNPQPAEADWLFDEDSGEAARSMAAPMTFDQPSRYKGHKWRATGDTSEDNDNGGVHINSGVQNFFFYLLCEGGTGDNDGIAYEVSGIGVEKAVQIAYRALTEYCGPRTDYESVKGCWESAALDLAESGIIESNDVESVAQAWAAVKTPRKTVDGPSWTVTLNSNGGALIGLDSKFPVAKGGAVGKLPVPERKGYSFKGWWTKKSGGSKVSASTKVTKNTTFYARWTVSKYKIAATANMSAGGTVSGAGTKTYGSKVTLKATPKKGYVFVEWVNLLDRDEPWPSLLKRRQPSVSFRVPAEDMYVRAVFAKTSEDTAPVISLEEATDWYVENEPERNVVIEAESLSYPTVTATGVPVGVLFSRYGDKTDSSYIIMPFSLSLMKPGVYTVKITAKNRAGKSSSKTMKIVTPNAVKAISDGLIAGLETSAHVPYVFPGGMKANTTLADLGIEVFATNGWKLASVTGLPTGLSWNGSAIVGAASKTGLYTVTFTMKKTVKTGKKTKTYTSTASATFKVEALLPDALAGVYNGFANTTVEDAEDNADGEGEGDGESVDEETHGVYTPLVDGGASAVKVTVTTAGKVTAKIGGVTLSGAGFDGESNGVYAVTLKKTQKIKTGKLKGKSKVWEAYIEIDTNSAWDDTQLVGWYSAYTSGLPGMAAPVWLSAQRNAFVDDDEAKAVAAAVAAFGTKGTVKFTPKAVKGETWAYDLVEGGTAVSVVAKAGGTATLSGKIGKTKISGTATLEVSKAEEVAVEAADPKATSCADEGCGSKVLRRTATARFISGGFVIEIVYTLDDGAVVSAAGRVWRK